MEDSKDAFKITELTTENLEKIDNSPPRLNQTYRFLRSSIEPSSYGEYKDKRHFEALNTESARKKIADKLGPDVSGFLLDFVTESGSELADMFPEASELERELGEKLQFYIWVREEEPPIMLVENADGRKSVFRMIYSPQRTLDEVNKDIPNRPSLIPSFSAIQLNESKIGFLIDFIEGQRPESKQEKKLCKKESDQLLNVPMKYYDVSADNFIIQAKTGKPYYVDSDIIEGIVRFGLSPETAGSRRKLLSEGLNSHLTRNRL